MKKIILSIAIVMSGYCSYAQWTNSGNDVYNINTGNVGIGTGNPGAKLTVYQAQNQGSAWTANNTFNVVSQFGNDANGNVGILAKNGGVTNYSGLWLNNSFDIYSYNNYAGWFRVMNHDATKSDLSINLLPDGNGKVGIGTTNPYTTLTIGSTDATAFITPGGPNTHLTLQSVGADGAIRFYTIGGSTNTAAPTESMRIAAGGNVGIGIIDTKGYKLAVNGSAIATSMTVKLYANWPDYVFKKEYQLPPLIEVKNYIDKNQHLPEMPSEQEVMDNGINLGEIVKVQTKKIEELTLYLIDKDKQVKQLQEQINQLKKDEETRLAVMEAKLARLTSDSK